MPQSRAEPALSPVELVVLARLSKSNPPSEDELRSSVAELLPDIPPERARAEIAEVVAALRRRGLVSSKHRTRTDAGASQLRKALGVDRAPAWDHLPGLLTALALGRPSGPKAARAAYSEEAVAAMVLSEKLGVARVTTTSALCDALIAELLGMTSGEMTLGRIRAHVLASRAAMLATGVDPAGDPSALAAKLAARAVGARDEDRPLARALGRRWLVQRSRTSTETGDGEVREPVTVVQPPEGAGGPPARGVQGDVPAKDPLLEVVRETIPRVGADGRYGSEKVFVSAIWRSIAHDRRLADLSLARFKAWLLSANREGSLVLARADLVGAMDRKQVSESEIEDRGSTFHFVLDQRNGAPASRRDSHAR